MNFKNSNDYSINLMCPSEPINLSNIWFFLIHVFIVAKVTFTKSPDFINEIIRINIFNPVKR